MPKCFVAKLLLSELSYLIVLYSIACAVVGDCQATHPAARTPTTEKNAMLMNKKPLSVFTRLPFIILEDRNAGSIFSNADFFPAHPGVVTRH